MIKRSGSFTHSNKRHLSTPPPRLLYSLPRIPCHTWMCGLQPTMRISTTNAEGHHQHERDGVPDPRWARGTLTYFGDPSPPNKLPTPLRTLRKLSRERNVRTVPTSSSGDSDRRCSSGRPRYPRGVPIPATEKLATAPREGGQKHRTKLQHPGALQRLLLLHRARWRKHCRYRYSEEPGAHLASPESQWAA